MLKKTIITLLIIVTPFFSKGTIVEPPKTETENFLFELGYIESKNNPRAYKNGYVGKYMFSHFVFAELNVKFEYNKFIKDECYFTEEEQDKICMDIFKVYKRYLNKYIIKYKNQKIKGITINETSVLAACHLVGSGNMIKFFESGMTYIPYDGNGVTILDYMRVFQKYNIIF